jgi:hypothetical protein
MNTNELTLNELTVALRNAVLIALKDCPDAPSGVLARHVLKQDGADSFLERLGVSYEQTEIRLTCAIESIRKEWERWFPTGATVTAIYEYQERVWDLFQHSNLAGEEGRDHPPDCPIHHHSRRAVSLQRFQEWACAQCYYEWRQTHAPKAREEFAEIDDYDVPWVHIAPQIATKKWISPDLLKKSDPGQRTERKP